MKSFLLEQLPDRMKKLNGQIYKKYKALQNTAWATQNYVIIFDKIQATPTSPPSHIKIRVPHIYSGFSPSLFTKSATRIPLTDLMSRKWEKLAKKISFHSGKGKSGIFYSESLGPQIVERSTFASDKTHLEIRFRFGLPSLRNRIDGESMVRAIQSAFPKISEEILRLEAYDSKKVTEYIKYYEDHLFLRKELQKKGWIAFVPNGAILPRENALNQAPKKNAIPFKSPPDLEVKIKLPNFGFLRGMALPKGITIITGGGFHGKTTLLNAIKMGIYTHIPGDGKEFLVSEETTVKINSEDGRISTGINISPYIFNLPLHQNEHHFSSQQCSGSTSQAASVMEALRMQSRCLLFDEDSSATNFLMCDPLMEKLIGPKDKTIFPYFSSVQDLFEKHQISTILVSGSISSGIFPATLVLKMSEYVVSNITNQAKKLLREASFPEPVPQKFNDSALKSRRIIDSDQFRIKKRKNPFKLKVLSSRKIKIDNYVLDFSDNEQLVDVGQAKMIANLILRLEETVYKRNISFETAIFLLFDNFAKDDRIFSDESSSGLTAIRPLDFAHAMNRFLFIKIKN